MQFFALGSRNEDGAHPVAFVYPVRPPPRTFCLLHPFLHPFFAFAALVSFTPQGAKW